MPLTEKQIKRIENTIKDSLRKNEPVAETIASLNFKFAQKQYVVGDTISEQAQSEIQRIMNDLTIGKTPNKIEEIERLIAIPYNPYEPKPYERWTLKGMSDIDQELKVAEELWNFLGNDGTYSELLNCFERAGIELRPEIDSYFFKIQVLE